MPNLSRFILRQRKLIVLIVHHVAEATQRTALNECEVKQATKLSEANVAEFITSLSTCLETSLRELDLYRI